MKTSTGILVYRKQSGKTEVLLVHPGGPFWSKKDAWGIPKGEYYESEEPLEIAKKEFEEEIGQPAPAGQYIDLGEVKLSGKKLKAFAIEGDVDASNIVSNTVLLEWPPRTGQKIEVPEVDKAKWFSLSSAIDKMHKGQNELVERLSQMLNEPIESPDSPAQGSLF
jgi:predicted NUDIX family NTP pyrophosphohydrolase